MCNPEDDDQETDNNCSELDENREKLRDIWW
jgi:hypothetical protein